MDQLIQLSLHQEKQKYPTDTFQSTGEFQIYQSLTLQNDQNHHLKKFTISQFSCKQQQWQNIHDGMQSVIRSNSKAKRIECINSTKQQNKNINQVAKKQSNQIYSLEKIKTLQNPVKKCNLKKVHQQIYQNEDQKIQLSQENIDQKNNLTKVKNAQSQADKMKEDSIKNLIDFQKRSKQELRPKIIYSQQKIKKIFTKISPELSNSKTFIKKNVFSHDKNLHNKRFIWKSKSIEKLKQSNLKRNLLNLESLEKKRKEKENFLLIVRRVPSTAPHSLEKDNFEMNSRPKCLSTIQYQTDILNGSESLNMFFPKIHTKQIYEDIKINCSDQLKKRNSFIQRQRQLSKENQKDNLKEMHLLSRRNIFKKELSKRLEIIRN